MIRKLISALFGGGFAKGGYVPVDSPEFVRMVKTAHFGLIPRDQAIKAFGRGPITAAELIGLLKTMPQNAPVAYASDSDSAFIAGAVELDDDGVVLLHPGDDR